MSNKNLNAAKDFIGEREDEIRKRVDSPNLPVLLNRLIREIACVQVACEVLKREMILLKKEKVASLPDVEE